MPRRISDYPDAFAGWNLISSYGSLVSVIATFIFLDILYLQLTKGKESSRYPWLTPQYYSDILRAMLDRAYDSLEWGLNSPPKPHSFTSLPTQSYFILSIVKNLINKLYVKRHLIFTSVIISVLIKVPMLELLKMQGLYNTPIFYIFIAICALILALVIHNKKSSSSIIYKSLSFITSIIVVFNAILISFLIINRHELFILAIIHLPFNLNDNLFLALTPLIANILAPIMLEGGYAVTLFFDNNGGGGAQGGGRGRGRALSVAPAGPANPGPVAPISSPIAAPAAGPANPGPVAPRPTPVLNPRFSQFTPMSQGMGILANIPDPRFTQLTPHARARAVALVACNPSMTEAEAQAIAVAPGYGSVGDPQFRQLSPMDRAKVEALVASNPFTTPAQAEVVVRAEFYLKYVDFLKKSRALSMAWADVILGSNPSMTKAQAHLEGRIQAFLEENPSMTRDQAQIVARADAYEDTLGLFVPSYLHSWQKPIAQDPSLPMFYRPYYMFSPLGPNPEEPGYRIIGYDYTVTKPFYLVPDSIGISHRGFYPNMTSQPYATTLADVIETTCARGDMPLLDKQDMCFYFDFLNYKYPLEFAVTGEILPTSSINRPWVNGEILRGLRQLP